MDRPKGDRWKVLGTILVVSVIWAVGILAWAVAHPKPAPYAPLGPYPIQTVNLPVTKVAVPVVAPATAIESLPTLTVKDGVWPDVPVTAQKCAKETVRVKSTGTEWRLVQPPGFVYRPSTGGYPDRVAGCQTFHFLNPVPQQVKERVINLSHIGDRNTVWQLQGSETPAKGGVTLSWESENFAIVFVP